MCGIAGIMTRDGTPPAADALDRLAAALAHRGPNGEGRYRQRATAMVHRRLAIIDLATGDQPLRAADGSALIANAEIYNYVELAGELDGVDLATRSDCELPLHLYRRDGLDFPRRLRGMYAIAIHDPARGRLVLARDPFGIKPLYYVERESHFAFASEPQALIAAGLASRTLFAPAVSELLQMQFTTGRDTPFAEIKRVLPGETLVVEKARVVARRRRAALPDGGPSGDRAAATLATLDAALEDSVRVHQRSDVPYGMFLSGGIDSSTVLALMARLNPRPVRAYTAGFAGASVADERAQAQAVARALGADHAEILITERDFWRLLPRVAAAIDDPCADYAIVPSFELARVAAKDVKVILSGEGGDELFAGYGRYRRALRPAWLGGRPIRGTGLFDGLGLLRDDGPGWRAGQAASERVARASGRSRLQAAQATDFADWLPNDLLTKLDRCLMAHGVEGRTPLLDRPLAELVFRLPDRQKIHLRRGKWLLRRWLAGQLPAARPFARKRGFTVPVGEWIAARGEALGALVAAQPGIDEICRPEGVAPLFAARGKRATRAAWTLLFYALWHRRHGLGLAPEGDVWDCLSASAAR